MKDNEIHNLEEILLNMLGNVQGLNKMLAEWKLEEIPKIKSK